MQICEKLKTARKNSGMTQEEVAEKIHVTRVSVSNWETGKTLPDIASLIELSDLYNLTLDELLKGDPKMTEKVKKDVKASQSKTRVIIAIAVVSLVFGIAYVVCRFIGGGAKEFAGGAAPWVMIAIALAGFAAMQNSENASKDSDDTLKKSAREG